MKVTTTFTIDEYSHDFASHYFPDRAAFDAYRALIWECAPRERLRDENPDRFPCVMISDRWSYPTVGPNLYGNFFFYDFTIEDDTEED